MKIITYKKVPKNSFILKNWHGDIHYIDSYQTDLLNPNILSIDELATMLFAAESPKWEKALIKLRDYIVSFFGLEKSSDLEYQVKQDFSTLYKPGDKVGFFPVIDRSESEIVMGMDDKHLEFRASILIQNSHRINQYSLSVTTVVKYINVWGQIYFSVAMPFHKFIVKQSIKRLLKQHKELMLTC